MKVITEPTVRIIAASDFWGHFDYKIPEDGTPVEKIGAFAAKGCYDAFLPKGRSNIENQKDIISSFHGSVLEHAVVSLFIEGIDRGCSHEIVRHRAGFSYSQRSTRYVNEGDCNIVLDPWMGAIWEKAGFKIDDSGDRPMIRNPIFDRAITNEEAIVFDYVIRCMDAITGYNHLVKQLITENTTEKRKWARGKARGLLPHAIETRMTMTGNIRAWRYFIEQRSDASAELQIRAVAAKVYQVLYPLAPVLFEDFEFPPIIDGIPVYKSKFRKV